MLFGNNLFSFENLFVLNHHIFKHYYYCKYVMMCHTYYINHFFSLKLKDKDYCITGMEVIKKCVLTIKNFTGVSAEIETVSLHM